jgi:hypothetical protein
MGRPIKNNADYFPHDADMRNDPKIKALRRKFSFEGYAIYSMIIEFLTDSDFFQFKNDNLTLELISGDFDCTPELLKNVLEYCITLDLLQTSETHYVRCKSLDNRLGALLSKRKLDRTRVIADYRGESTQSKVKKSKVKKRREREAGALAPTPAKSIDERKEDFYKQLVPFVDRYDKKLIRAFFEYWTENNAKGKKFRKEMQKVFDIEKRLATWAKREKEFHPEAETPPPEDKYAEARYNRTMWKPEVWKQSYAKQIESDEGFRKEFQL